MLEPTHLLTLAEHNPALNRWRCVPPWIHDKFQDAKTDAGKENGRHWHKRDALVRGWQCRAYDHALVLAIKPFHAPQRDGIDVPGIAPDMRDLLDQTIVGGVKTMVHAGGQSQGDVGAVAVGLRKRAILQQIFELVAGALDLHELGAGDRPASADDRITGTDERIGVVVERPASLLELADEAVAQARELRLLCLAQIDIAEEAPNGDRAIADDGVFELAEPTHETRGKAPGNAVRQREVEGLLLEQSRNEQADCHLVSQFFG